MNAVEHIAENAAGARTPRSSEVQFAGPAKRRHGAPLGNHNRLKYGAFSKAAGLRKAEIHALIVKAEALIVRAGMVAKARRALKHRQKHLASRLVRTVYAFARILALLPKWLRELWLTRQTTRTPPLARMC